MKIIKHADCLDSHFRNRTRAQMDSGTVLGTIRDQSGAVVPGAVVTLTNEGTALAASTTSGADGSYIFTPVRIGAYSVTSEAKGFKKVTQVHVTVDVQQRAVVDFTLAPGAVSETVEVPAALWSHRKVWRRIYRALIPNHRTLGKIERREAERQLRQTMHWRLSARRRRRKRYGQLTLELSGL